MPKKGFVKSKRWRLACKRKALAGQINNEDGAWRLVNSSKSIELMYQAGNRGGNR